MQGQIEVGERVDIDGSKRITTKVVDELHLLTQLSYT